MANDGNLEVRLNQLLSSSVEGSTNALKILIVKLSAVGDVVHALPALHALRTARPDGAIAEMVVKYGAVVAPKANRPVGLIGHVEGLSPCWLPKETPRPANRGPGWSI